MRKLMQLARRCLSAMRRRQFLRQLSAGVEFLEDRQLLALTVNHIPYVQLGDAPLIGSPNYGADQVKVLWQTTGTQGGSEKFTVKFRADEIDGGNWQGPFDVTTPSIPQAVVADGTRQIWSFLIDDLPFSTSANPVKVDYEVTHVGGAAGPFSGTYTTRLEAGDETGFTFVAYGDSADGGSGFGTVQTAINSIVDGSGNIVPAFALNLGDNAYDSGTHTNFDARFDTGGGGAKRTWNKQRIDFLAYGNHDVFNGGGASSGTLGKVQEENYDVPKPALNTTSLVPGPDVPRSEHNFSFDYGDVHFLSFDSTFCGLGGNCFLGQSALDTLDRELDWAVSDLKESDARWRVVFVHNPVASLVDHIEHTPDDYYYDQVVSRLREAGADLFLTGHTHNYQRSFPLLGHNGSTATFETSDALVGVNDDQYVKGVGLNQMIVGVGGHSDGYNANNSVFNNTYVARGRDGGSSSPNSAAEQARLGFLRVDVTQNQLRLRYVNAEFVSGNPSTGPQFLDDFVINAPASDTEDPVAWVGSPLDNGPDDSNATVGSVSAAGSQQSLVVKLSDGDGVGIDDTIANDEDVVSLRKDGVLWTEGTEYTFAYDSTTNRIVLQRPIGMFEPGEYKITLTGTPEIEDLAGNALASTTFTVVINPPVGPLTLLEKGSEWIFLHPLNGVNPTTTDADFNTTWFTDTYDDSAWTTLATTAIDPMGYGELGPAGATINPRSIGTPPSGSRYTAYFRTEFNVDDASAVQGPLTFRVLRDDGIAIYLNGSSTAVVRDKLNVGATYTSPATGAAVGDNEELAYLEFTVDPALLRDGANLLAVEVHQVNTTSSDIGFDLEIEAVVEQITATFTNGHLVIDGTVGNDTITVSAAGGFVTLNGVALPGNIVPSTVQRITVNGLDSDDTIDLSGVNSTNGFTHRSLSGNVVISGGGGDDDITGSPLDDVILAGVEPHAGLLDASFDGDGISITDFGFGSSSVVHDLAVDGNGKLVAVGYAYNGAAQGDLAVARFNVDGSPDTTFSSDGVASLDLGSYEMGKAVAIQSDGKILMAGHTKTFTGDSDFALARFNTSGSLDTSFNGTGSVTTNFAGGSDEAVTMAVQSDGKIVLAGVGGGGFAMARYNTNGSLDTSFGTGGKVTASISNFYNDRMHMALQSDGKIVVAGGNADFLVARFTTSGSLDTTYGTNGVATVDFGGSDAGRGLALDSSGRAVVSGETWDASGRDFAAARLTTSGAVDTTFDSDGKVRTNFPQNGQDAAYDVAVDSAGRIVVMGFASGVHNSDFAVVRYLSNGSLDNDFGDGGLVVTEVVIDGDYPNAMALNSHNDIFLSGYVFVGYIGTDFGITKYIDVESDNDEVHGGSGNDEIIGGPGHDVLIGGEGPHAGILDETFDDDGILITDFGFGSSSVAHDIVVDANGKLVAVGYAYNGGAEGDLAISRYNVDGSADTSFSSDGVASLNLGAYEMGKAVAIQSDGKILMAGHTKTFTGDSDFALARFNTDGSLDTGFGASGSVTTNFAGGRDEAVAMVVQSDGKIVLAGGSGSNLALARYNSNGTLDTSFDTDGKVSVSISNFVEPYNEVRLNLALQSDGKIVVAGGLVNILVARFTTSGSLDTTYGSSGVATVDFGGTEIGRSIALDSSGRAVVAGETWDASGRDFAVARLTTSGTLDTSFDGDGKVRTNFPENGQDAAYDVAIDGAGRIVVGGFAAGPTDSDFAMARYLSNGSLDNAFGDAGLVVTEVVVDGDFPNAMAINNSNNEIFLAGYVFDGVIGTEFGIANYLGDVPSDNDILIGGSGNDELFGGPGDDTLEGGTGNDVLEGGFNQDTFVFASSTDLGQDVVRGGPGIDTLDFAALGAAITIDLDIVTQQNVAAGLIKLTLPDLDLENVIGTAFADSIRGTWGNNVLTGGAGNDVLYSHMGVDTLNGGSGNDTYVFDSQSSGTVNVQESANVDADTLDFTNFGAGITVTLSAVTLQTVGGGLALMLSTNTGIENVVGTVYADTMNGNTRNNSLTGGAGNDNLYGFGGSDTIHGNAGNDYIRGGDQPDQLYGDADADTAYGDLDDNLGDTILGGDGNDLLYGDTGSGYGYGYGGPDLIQGDAGVDTAYGEAANDSIYGGTENDTLHGGEGSDSIWGDDGNDSLYGDNGYPSGYSNDDVLTGGNGDDYAYGGYGNDSLYGNDGNDNLDGGYGNDTLRGDAGNDSLSGGYGSDNYIFDGNASGSDTVNELANMDTDTLDFSAFAAGINLNLNSTSAQNVGGSLTLTLASNNTGIENVYGTANNDTIYGNSRNNLLKGNDGNDWLYGGYGDDTMYGGIGDDHMYGEAGTDYLFGELGADDLWGGAGIDVLNAGGNTGDQEHQD